MKQLLYIHGGEAWDTTEDYKAWLASSASDFRLTDPSAQEHTWTSWSKTLEEVLGNDWQVLAPAMPSKDDAKYELWKIWLERHAPFFADEVTIVGYSLGANFVAKYLAENTFPGTVRALHLVAGCYGWKGGFALPTSLERLSEQVENITIYHAKDDPVVPVAEAEKYHKALPTATVQLFEDRGHFFQEAFPELITNIKT